MISFYRLRPKTDQNSNRMDRIRNGIAKKREVEISKMMKEKEKWESLSDLEKIPDEVFNQIINFVPESIGILRETSSTMKKSIRRFRNLRGFKPAISYLSIRQDEILPRLSVLIGLNRITEQYFEFPRSKHLSYRMKWSRIAETDSIFFDELKKSLSMRVETLYLVINRDLNEHLLKELLDGITFDYLSLRLPNTFDSDKLLQFIANLGAEKIGITVENLSIPNPEEFLLRLAEIVTEIHISQYKVESIPKESGYFFGTTKGDWGRIFPEMFKRQMDSLSIYNLDYSSYLPESTCQDLVEVLTEVSEKELRFVSSFHPCKIVTGEKRRTVHDYDILERIIVDEYRCSKAFYITHNNRQPLVHY